MAEPSLELVTMSDGARCHVRCWAAEGHSRGTIVVIHGIQSHGGWYTESSSRLAGQGWNVWLPDRRGAGLNSEARGDTPGFRRLIDDVAESLDRAIRPRVLAGISWGGKLAVALQKRHPGLCDGLVLIAPGLRPRIRPSIRERTRIAGARFMSPLRRFPIPLGDAELFTANPARQQFIREDPLGLHEATARFLFESARLDIYLHFARRRVVVPALILLAERDRIIDNAATRRYVQRFATRDLTICEYTGAHHTLEFEPQGPPFISDLAEWLRRLKHM